MQDTAAVAALNAHLNNTVAAQADRLSESQLGHNIPTRTSKNENPGLCRLDGHVIDHILHSRQDRPTKPAKGSPAVDGIHNHTWQVFPSPLGRGPLRSHPVVPVCRPVLPPMYHPASPHPTSVVWVLENSTLTKHTLVTRTTAAMFMVLVCNPRSQRGLSTNSSPTIPRRATILEQLRQSGESAAISPSDSFLSESKLGGSDGFTQQEQRVCGCYEHVRAAYNG
ncbi:hypothetical protein OG21DRAFT_1512321 [Imleria badia]|nr:hypothetical protein OG21DRAFT_1512321 [Imleria badia]